MPKRYSVLLLGCLLLANIAGQCGEAPDSHSLAPENVLAPHHPIQRYSGDWCIVTFIANSRSSTPRNALTTARSTNALTHPGIPSVVLATGFPLRHRPTFIDLLLDTRFLPLMTLWRGQENAVLVGIDDNGMLGVTLNEEVAAWTRH